MNLRRLALLTTFRWRMASLRRSPDGYDWLLRRAMRLGEWLRRQDYVGVDVSVDNPPAAMSTVPASAMVGWLNLARLTGKQFYKNLAEDCLERILDDQTGEGCWLFPYRFRQNPAKFPYSCENFMTIECLMEYYQRMGSPQVVLEAIQKSLAFLLQEVGHEGGVFWYSPSDKIRVPNISSMAARVFAVASRMMDRSEYLALARGFAQYCTSHQAPSGGYPYFQEDSDVYIPYHALEIWELAEANEVLKDSRVAESVGRATQYLRRFLEKNGYVSFDPVASRHIVMKTPIWSARAFLATGFIGEAVSHLSNGLRLFTVPGKSRCFYALSDFKGLKIPLFDSCFIRYNASAFEISTSLLCRLQTNLTES